MHGDGCIVCPACGFAGARVRRWPWQCRCGIMVQEDCSWESRGLGDTVAKITAAVGIKPCGGCKERQKKLNDAMPYQS